MHNNKPMPTQAYSYVIGRGVASVHRLIIIIILYNPVSRDEHIFLKFQIILSSNSFVLYLLLPKLLSGAIPGSYRQLNMQGWK